MGDGKQVAVAHHNLMAKGGAEGVAMNVLESLQHQYDITLFTLVYPDIHELNKYFNTNVDEEAVKITHFGSIFSVLYDRSDRFHLFKCAVLSRMVKQNSDYFDLVVSTYNEMTVHTPSIQYIHMPQYRRWLPNSTAKDGLLPSIYDKLCRTIEGFEANTIRTSTLVANSMWTANVTEEAYDVQPTVLYPPVDTTGFVDTPWSKRESGFVTIGRLTPYKNVLRTIEIIERLNDRGHDVHLHIVGPALDTDYTERVRAAATTSDFVHLEEEVTRAELVALISTHKYGIHGTDEEHFGMVVAELAAGGTIPFIPNGGGQCEIVRGREELLYQTVEEAVEKLSRVLSDPDLQLDLRDELDDIEERFGRDRFRRNMREIVDKTLNEPEPPG